jgi:hypothetical protein
MIEDQVSVFENAQALPQRGKACSVSGFAHTKWGQSLSRKGTVPILYTMPAQPSNGFLKHLPDLLKAVVSKMLEGKYFLDKEA